MTFADQIWAAQQMEDIHREWKINPDYPQDVWAEFDKLMFLIGKFVREE